MLLTGIRSCADPNNEMCDYPSSIDDPAPRCGCPLWVMLRRSESRLSNGGKGPRLACRGHLDGLGRQTHQVLCRRTFLERPSRTVR